MRAVVLGCAASAAAIVGFAAPAAAEHWSDPGFIAAASVGVHRGGGEVMVPSRRGDDFRRRDGRRDHRRRDRDFDGPALWIGDWEWQGDSAWRATSYNDWWHERPHRSFPRWMQNNQDCTRQWWSGAGWRC